MGKTKEELLQNAPAYQKIDELQLRDQDFVKKALAHANCKELLSIQRKTLNYYIRHYLARSLAKPVSVYNSLYHLKYFGIGVKKPFLEVTSQDIENYFISLRSWKKWGKKTGSPLKERTIIGKNVALKSFFKWLYVREGIKYEGDYPELVKDLNTKVPRNEIQPSDLLTPIEVRSMIEACYKQRDKAVISVLYESGCRALELCSLKIKDVNIETQAIELSIRVSKTIPRTVILINSYLHLLDYLNVHPYKKDPEAPLFINTSNGQFGRSLLYQGLDSVVRTAKKRAGIRKRVTLHLFRHSRATELAAKGWTEAQLRKWFGWSVTSGTPTIYVHIGQSDIKKKVFEEHGLLSEQESIEELQQRTALEPVECQSCGERNPPDAISCHCGRALTVDAAKEIKQLREKTDTYMGRLNEVPLRSSLVKDGMSQLEYKKALIKSDPFLREEFEIIAKEILDKIQKKQAHKEALERFSHEVTKPISRRSLREKYQPEILKLRRRGWPMTVIAKELGIGYGTVYLICKKHKLIGRR